MKCPVCTNVDLLMSEKQGVEIDYCPTCRGVWLDRGELEKIVERQPAGAATYQTDPIKVPPQQHVERNQPYDRPEHYDKHGPGKRKKESFLGELFDF
jgi:Zn-finger nucleic acid-binding protein